LLGLVFDPEDGNDMFLRNIGGFLPNCGLTILFRIMNLQVPDRITTS
jgi:hypothetical protein